MKKLNTKVFSITVAMLLLLMCMFTVSYADSETVTVKMTVQGEGMFLVPYGNYEVSSGLSDIYGYTDEVSGVSVLDAVIKAHEVYLGTDSFTPETASEYLVYSSGWISSAFGIESAPAFAVNGVAPNDGIFNEAYNGYTGYTVGQAELKNDDFVEFFFYADPWYGDNYVWFEKNDSKIDSLTVRAGDDVTLSLDGYCYAYYSCSKQETIDLMTGAISDAQIAYVDEYGCPQAIEGVITDESGTVTLNFDTAGEYIITAYTTSDSATPCAMPTLKVTVLDANSYVKATVTVPKGCSVDTGSIAKSFVITHLEPCDIIKDTGTDSYSYYIPKKKNYFYRVSGENMVTYANRLYIEEDTVINVTDDQLYADGSKTSKTIIRDFSNNTYDVGDIYLNINEKGHLVLEENSTYQIVNLRNWQLIEGISNALPIEPDYHYTVIDENGQISDSVVTIDDNGLITAVGNGTAIVLVTYDAITYDYAYGGGGLFSAIWPENTGVFVVSVGQDNAEINTGMYLNSGLNTTETKLSGDSIDAEIDVLYYLKGTDGAEYSFKPEEGATVSVLRPNVSDDKLSYSGGFTNDGVTVNDGTYTVSGLSEGRNIIKVTVGENSTYQVVTAKELSYNVDVTDNTVTVTFDRVYHPANKLSGIYNMNARINYYNGDTLIQGTAKQYNFASNSDAQKITFEIPEGYTESTITLTNGNIYTSSWGSPYGSHRGVTYTDGKDPNFTAVSCTSYLGRLPDITINLKNDIILGDVNADGTIDVNDAVLLVEYIGTVTSGGALNEEKFPNGTFPGGEESAKLTADDIINVNDVVLLVEYIGTKAAGGELDPVKFPDGKFPGASL